MAQFNCLYFLNAGCMPWFSYLKAKREQRLPCILSKQEVFCILDHLSTFHFPDITS